MQCRTRATSAWFGHWAAKPGHISLVRPTNNRIRLPHQPNRASRALAVPPVPVALPPHMSASAEPRRLASRAPAAAPHVPLRPRRLGSAPAAFNARRRGAAEAGRRGGGGSPDAGVREARRWGSDEADAWGRARQRGHDSGGAGRAQWLGLGRRGWRGRSRGGGGVGACVARARPRCAWHGVANVAAWFDCW
ncbi:hypothetical protein GUJ93_ZPchr0013g34190 [Zizania palustris]|uniref:Uncharacterized protein n=1 Tax=Zizania palustris TaxID=103762 RepID=A0A8J6C373_ZIZPA|nr:hypothetical protein GUJ93_ZPchr0013g34190 [Zizania palustris]